MTRQSGSGSLFFRSGVKHGICFSLYQIRYSEYTNSMNVRFSNSFEFTVLEFLLSFSFFCFEFFQRAPAAKHAPVRLTSCPHYWESRLIRIKWRAFINFQNLTANIVPEQWRESETLIVKHVHVLCYEILGRFSETVKRIRNISSGMILRYLTSTWFGEKNLRNFEKPSQFYIMYLGISAILLDKSGVSALATLISSAFDTLQIILCMPDVCFKWSIAVWSTILSQLNLI